MGLLKELHYDHPVTMITQSRDTSPAAERVLVELWRQASPERKWAAIEDLRRTAKAWVLAGLRERHPHASEAELERRLAGSFLGEELAAAVYGPLPMDRSPRP